MRSTGKHHCDIKLTTSNQSTEYGTNISIANVRIGCSASRRHVMGPPERGIPIEGSCSFAHGPQCFKSKRVSFLGRSDTGGGCFSCGGGGAGAAGSGLGC